MHGKLGIVVQRYGLEINGGAEYHARLIAKHLSKNHQVEVLTTCAVDYVTWAQHYPPGEETIDGVTVRRFPVDRERDPKRFGDLQKIVVNHEHTAAMEEAWMQEQGPASSAMREYVLKNQDDYDLFIFFSFRYYTTFTILPMLAGKSILVPTAEHDEIIYLRLFKAFFQLPAAIAYNSFEERDLIWKISQNQTVPGLVVGVGSEIPPSGDGQQFRQKFSIEAPYALYIGRLDENKGVPLLFEFFIRYAEQYPQDGIHLVLAGKTIVPIPQHPRIHYIGFIDDQDKYNALAGAEFLVIPSQFESLSMVTLEAWAMGKPVLANGRTDVLKGQCMRSHAGLWFMDYGQFCRSWRLLAGNRQLRETMGENGCSYFKKQYSWPVIEAKYEQLLAMASGSLIKKADLS